LHKQYGPKPIKEPKINPQLVDIRLNSAENLQSAPRIKAKTDGDLLVEAYEKLEKQKTNFIEVKEKRKSATVVSESKTEVRAQIKEYTDRLNSNYIELNDLELQSSSHKVKAQMGILNQEQAILRAQIKGLKRELGTLLRKERASR